jgi:hypothetical protein
MLPDIPNPLIKKFVRNIGFTGAYGENGPRKHFLCVRNGFYMSGNRKIWILQGVLCDY